MDKSNKKLILKEIDSWRTNRLLPAEYCDFLSNLYAEGETFSSDQKTKNSFGVRRTSVPWRRLFSSLAVSLLLLLFVLHFTSFPNWMQIVILVILTVAFYCLAFFARLPIALLRIVFLTSACLLVALDGYFFVRSTGLTDSPEGSLMVLVLVLLIWIVSGTAGESRMIVSISWLAIGIFYHLVLQYVRQVAGSDYGMNTVYWLIFSVVSIGVGVFLGRTKLFVAPSWAIIGVLAVMVPDFLYLLSGAKPNFVIDVTAFLKLSLLVTLIIVFREGIQNWLDSFKMRQYNRVE
ncbi:hypothetical protein [Effusibacillus consociatus]|uniref:DUF2157 domain-containing protein n=1 Tax=Effusibacillus consociatus TaxID=1117041 RepID=A0ABV9Q276_9BACL